MMGIWVQESVEMVQRKDEDDEERVGLGESDPYETDYETPGELYRLGVREHGRCAGKVYIDRKDGPVAVGWIFEKRDRYEDCYRSGRAHLDPVTGEHKDRHKPECYYLRRTWVTLYERGPERTVRTFPLVIGKPN